MTSDFVTMAKAIASTAKKNTIPEMIVRTLGDVIAARGACTEYYAAQSQDSDESTKKSNITHQHFVKVLKDVRGILMCSNGYQSSSEPAKNSTEKSVGEQVEEMNNLFDYLDIEEPTE